MSQVSKQSQRYQRQQLEPSHKDVSLVSTLGSCMLRHHANVSLGSSGEEDSHQNDMAQISTRLSFVL